MSTEGERQIYPADFDLIPLHKWNAKSKGREAGKRPLHTNWTTRRYVAAELAAHTGNFGVRLKADQLVIDVDPRNGGAQGFEILCWDYNLDTSLYPCVETGGGGRHYYLTKPADAPIVDTLDGYKGVEFKSVGRQVVAAGSTHPNGKPYRAATGSKPLSEVPAVPSRLLAAIRRPEPQQAIGGGQYTQEQIARMLDKLDSTNFRGHDLWLRLMMACHHASNGDARSEFVEWSTSDPQYMQDAEIIGRRWDSLHREKSGAVTFRTLNMIVAEHGDADTIPAQDASGEFDAVDPTPAIIEPPRGLSIRKNIATDTFKNALAAIAKSNLKPEWNELQHVVMFRSPDLPWDESHGRILNDNLLRVIRFYLVGQFQGVAYEPGKENLLEALTTLALRKRFNPVLEYVDGLKWDDVPRVERLFPDYFNCCDDAYTRAVSRCFMVGAVRRMRQPGCKFDTMPIIRSSQGWNKSTAIKTLFGAEWFSDSDLGNLHNKDAAMTLRGKWAQEFADLDTFNRAEINALKAFVSRAVDRIRDPYGRIAEDHKRTSVFIGTTNEGGYLKDGTGGRRFWPLDVTKPIDVARIEADRDQIWSEAAWLESIGASAELPGKLWAMAGERQAAETTDDPWADELNEFLDTRAKRFEEHGGVDDLGQLPPPDRALTSELFQALEIRPRERTKGVAQRLRTVMEHSLGWKHSASGIRVNDKRGKGYIRRT